MEILTDWMGTGGAGQMLSRYLHYLSGITWIGLLYYFNFVQVPAFAEMEPGPRSEALRKITFRALWWFRFGALLTFLSGVLILGFQRALGEDFGDYFARTQGISIAWGALLGTTMFLNVWGIIWPAQKVVIGSAEQVAAGGEADPAAPAAALAAGRASRVNTLFSIPMLWFMGFTSHFSFKFEILPGAGVKWTAWVIFVLLWIGIEAVALGYAGGHEGELSKLLFADHRKTILAGFVLWLVLYIVCFEILIGGS